MIGERLGRYLILAEIGAGGMGVVYRAEDERLNRAVALKVLHSGSISDTKTRTRFRREARILSQLNHPHIATIFDFDTEEGIDFLVMEFVPGESLDQILKRGTLSEKEVVRIGIQLFEALEEAHEQGVIHRDLKPGNILLTPKEQVKVLDFGLAKFVETAVVSPGSLVESLTSEGSITGTVPYMSPEQLRGEELDERSDLYSAGAVLYELITGQRPFPETQVHLLIEAILHKSPTPPIAIKPAISSNLDNVIQKSLKKSSQQRYQSASSFLDDLRLLDSGATIAVARTPFRTRFFKWLVPAVGGLALLLALLLIFDPTGWRQRLLSPSASGEIESIAVLPLKNLSADPSVEYLADGMTEQLISSLANIGALRVISRTSIMTYKNSEKSIQEIAEDLDVDAILEGSVAHSGERVRITANLIEVESERHILTEEREGEISEIFALQTEVAQSIAAKMRVTVTAREEARLSAGASVQPQAFELYLRGRYLWNKRNADDLQKALEYFEQAAQIDPEYAHSYVGIADCYNLFERYGVLPPEVAFPKAKEAARRALEIDPQFGEAHTSLAFALFLYDWDWDGARREFELALDLKPNYATAHHWYSVFLRATGELDTALEEANFARTLDPLSNIIIVNIGDTYFYRREFEIAVERYQEALELDQYTRPALIGMAYALSQLGDSEGAVEALGRAQELAEEDPRVALALAYIKAKSDNNKEAREALDGLSTRVNGSYVSPTLSAAVYSEIGEKDRAFDLLGTALEKRDADLVYMMVDPRFDGLRSDPRFDGLMDEIGFQDSIQD